VFSLPLFHSCCFSFSSAFLYGFLCFFSRYTLRGGRPLGAFFPLFSRNLLFSYRTDSHDTLHLRSIGPVCGGFFLSDLFPLFLTSPPGVLGRALSAVLFSNSYHFPGQLFFLNAAASMVLLPPCFPELQSSFFFFRV